MPSHWIETPRLLLCPFTPEDVDDLHRLWIAPDMRRFLWDDQVISRETAVAVVESSIESFEAHGFGFWSVYFKDQPALIGFCGLRHFSDDEGCDPEVEILYGIAAEHWNRGLASEAARAVLGFGFEKIGLETIYAGADPPNAASISVMEKLGLKFAKRTRIDGLEAIYYAASRRQGGP